MPTMFGRELEDSPAPGIIPEPISVHNRFNPATGRAARRAAERAGRLPSGQEKPRSILFARLLGFIRGET
jgi:hypothetical protein